MQRSNRSFLVAFLIAIFAVIGANAGGPLQMWNAEQRIPYRWDVTSPVKVYTDIGPFEIIPAPNVPIPNEIADGVVAFSLKQWTDVPTSSFQAEVAGDFASIGLPDINGTNAGLVVGAENSGGITVIYDADARIMRDFFGVQSTVLGIASPEWADESTGTITEGWVVINAQQRWVGDDQLKNYAGVFTHELGHSFNLAHSQTNGAIAFYSDARGPATCTNLPYNAASITTNDIETMYPFISPRPTNGSGVQQSTVDRPDDMSAISDLYPAPGYPASKGSIKGKVLQTNGKDGLTGVNVIARNVDAPFSDAVSAMSGDWVRVPTGDDGTFTLNGLTPGARYALYTDGIVNGGFPTAQPFYIPGPEEFYNGASESGNTLTDDRCQSEAITAIAGTEVEADITLNSVNGAPKFTPMASSTVPNSISSDGRIIGGSVLNGPVFRYTDEDGYEVLSSGVTASGQMSRDGNWFAGDNPGPAGSGQVASIVNYGAGGPWQLIPTAVPILPAIAKPCTNTSVAYGVASGGVAATGHMWVDGNGPAAGQECRTRPWIWTKQGGSQILPTPEIRSARPNTISDDGSTVVGWYELLPGGNRRAAVWKNGVLTDISKPGYDLGEAYNTTPDGSVIIGSDGGPTREPWRWSSSEGIKGLGRLYPFGAAGATGVSDDGNVIVGLAGSTSRFPTDITGRRGFLWTPTLGTVDFEQFLRAQGTYFEGWYLNTGLAMSADGTRLVGVGFGPRGQGGWIIDLDKVNVCHAPPGNPSKAHTINIPFRDAMNAHLAHGDTIGVCVDDVE